MYRIGDATRLNTLAVYTKSLLRGEFCPKPFSNLAFYDIVTNSRARITGCAECQHERLNKTLQDVCVLRLRGWAH
ncbi:hypothetical protein ACFLV0_04120 [Chloroflexota bacterium]